MLRGEKCEQLLTPNDRLGHWLSDYKFAVYVGVVATFCVVAVFGLHLAFGDESGMHKPAVVTLLTLAALVATVVALLPWDRLVAIQSADTLFYSWSITNTFLVSAYIYFTGGPRSAGYVLYFLIVVFNAAAYNLRGQIALALLILGLYIPVAIRASLEVLLVQVSTLGIFFFMAASLGQGVRARRLTELRKHQLVVLAEESQRQVNDILSTVEKLGSEEGFDPLPVVVEKVGHYSKARASAVGVYNRSAQWLELQTPLWGDKTEAKPVGWTVSRSEWEVLEREAEFGVQPLSFLEGKFRRYLGKGPTIVTLFRGSEGLEGVLAARRSDDDDPFNAIDRRRLGRLARAAGIVLSKASLVRKLEFRAHFDGLTGLINRASFLSRLEEEMAVAKRQALTLPLLLMDLDGFKRINDTFGHQTGDNVLRSVAGLLKSVVRVSDVLARYGGDEFCLLLPRSGTSEAQALGERLCARILTVPLEEAITTFTLSLSIGIAVYPTDAATAEGILASADSAMYEAKKAGGNRVVRANPPIGPSVTL